MTDESTEPGAGSESSSLSDVFPSETAPQEALAGRVVGIGTGVVPCDECRQELREGQSVIVYSYRLSSYSEWALARCYCEDCVPDQILGPRPDTGEVLVEATLESRPFPNAGMRRLCLSNVEIRACSPPTERGHQ